MSELAPLIEDLAFILVLAGIVTIFCKKFNQPLVLGYILAGFFASPHFNLLPNVVDTANITVWSDIGVIFILFSLGLDFNFAKIKSIGGTALIAAVTELAGITLLGYACARLLGWQPIDSFFAGAMLTMSSTAVVSKTFEELGLLKERFTQFTFGILVLEDISGIIMMVMLSTIAAAGAAISGTEMLGSIGELAFFLIICFVCGIFFLPTFFRKVSRYLTSETLLIFSLGLCLSMVVLATKMGFSSALGAFLMGSLLSGTAFTETTKKLLTPVKDLFSGIFFVSVGMMVDPALIIKYALPIAVLTAALIIGKIIFSSLGVLLAGKDLQTALRCGFSLTQLGEITFIVASIGAALKVTSDFLYPVFVAVSVISIFLTPSILRHADKVSGWLLRNLPARLLRLLPQPDEAPASDEQRSAWKELLQSYFTRLTVFCVILSFLAYLGQSKLLPYCHRLFDGYTADIIAAVILLLCMGPFLMAVMFQRVAHTDLIASLWFQKPANHLPIFLLLFIKIAVGLFFILSVFTSILGFSKFIAFAAACILAKFIYSSEYFVERYLQIEAQFMINLNAKTLAAQKKHAANHPAWLDEQLHVKRYRVAATSLCGGKSLKELNLHRRYNVFVLEIQNGSQILPIPSGSAAIYAGSQLLLTGTPRQLQNFELAIQSYDMQILPLATDNQQTLHQFLADPKHGGTSYFCYAMPIDRHSPLCGSTLKKSSYLGKVNCLALGLERGNYTHLNPDASFVFQKGDILWIIGTQEMMNQLFISETI